MKTCSKCKVEKSESEYSRNARYCKVCKKEYDRARNQKLKEIDPDYFNRRSAEYNRKNPEKVLAIKKAYRERNIDVCRAKHQEHKKANRVRFTEYENRRLAKKKGAYTEPVDFVLLLQENPNCYLCDKPLEKPIHFDHVIPISKGGPHTTANILPTHAHCNLSKGDKLV